MGEREPLRFERRDQVLWCTIDRPEKRNAMTTAMYDDLAAALAGMDADDELRAAVLTGAGDQAFCAGSDIGDRIGTLTDRGYDAVRLDRSARFFSRVRKPIVAAVNGYCIGGGLEMLLGTDLRVAVEDAYFSLPEVKIGIVAAGGSHVRLPQQVPHAVAMELLLLGGRVDARRAYEVGLVNRVVPRADFTAAVEELVAALVANAPLAVQASKSIVRGVQSPEAGFVAEHEQARAVFESADAREGREAFLAKRAPRFTGA
jgi:enoyl-CoA hydratase/carnithine racemase